MPEISTDRIRADLNRQRKFTLILASSVVLLAASQVFSGVMILRMKPQVYWLSEWVHYWIQAQPVAAKPATQ